MEKSGAAGILAAQTQNYHEAVTMGKNTQGRRRAHGWLWAACALWWPWAVAAAAGDRACDNPVFIQVAARIADKQDVTDKIDAWREFIQFHPDNPCIEQARARLRALEASDGKAAEDARTEEWKQQARGGLIEPGRDVLPALHLMRDPVPRYQVWLHNELVALTDEGSFRAEVGEVLWAGVLRIDAAPVYNLGLSVEVPFAAGSLDAEGTGAAVGNIVLGVRGIWGSWLGDDRYPLVVSGGVEWGTGSSLWTPASRKPLLDALSFAAPCFYHLFRYDQSSYIAHVEARLGLGRHFLAAGIAYGLTGQGKPVALKLPPDPAGDILGFDVAYQLEVSGWLVPFVELRAGRGTPATAEIDHIFLSPGVHLRFGHVLVAAAVRVPFCDASDLNLLTVSLSAGGRL